MRRPAATGDASAEASASAGKATCRFSADTLVATPSGEQTIGSLKVGDLVEAYNTATGQTEAEPVQHVWVNHDHDLVDVGVQSATGSGAKPRHADAATGTAHAPATAGSTRRSTAGKGPTGWLRATLVAGLLGLALVRAAATPAQAAPLAAPATPLAQETVHTTANHPWLTADQGWVPAGMLKPGELLVTLSGTTGTVAQVRATPGAAAMYNLTVAHDHTYAVGAGQWVVHNTKYCGQGPVNFELNRSDYSSEEQQAIDEFIQRSNEALQKDMERGIVWKRTPTGYGKGSLRDLATKDANAWAKVHPGPQGWQPGHVPDTVWTGGPQPRGGYMWIPASANEKFGRWSQKYENGYVVTNFVLTWLEPEEP